jgi:hypothetical protein
MVIVAVPTTWWTTGRTSCATILRYHFCFSMHNRAKALEVPHKGGRFVSGCSLSPEQRFAAKWAGRRDGGTAGRRDGGTAGRRDGGTAGRPELKTVPKFGFVCRLPGAAARRVGQPGSAKSPIPTIDPPTGSPGPEPAASSRKAPRLTQERCPGTDGTPWRLASPNLRQCSSESNTLPAAPETSGHTIPLSARPECPYRQPVRAYGLPAMR